jgi:hypothetical protein
MTVSTFDAAYTLVALAIFQRAQDALPVGYASAEGAAKKLSTPQGARALELIKAQANFLVEHMIADNGLFIDSLSLDSTEKNPQQQTLASQFAAIRGLVAASIATGDKKYLTAAKNTYIAIEQRLYDKKLGTWAEVPGKPTVHTPWTAAAISGGLRSVMLHLKNQDGATDPTFDIKTLTDRYVSWFRIVIDGGMQMAEWPGDTGEHLLKVGNGDADADGVPSVVKVGVAQTLAAEVSVAAEN